MCSLHAIAYLRQSSSIDKVNSTWQSKVTEYLSVSFSVCLCAQRTRACSDKINTKIIVNKTINTMCRSIKWFVTSIQFMAVLHILFLILRFLLVSIVGIVCFVFCFLLFFIHTVYIYPERSHFMKQTNGLTIFHARFLYGINSQIKSEWFHLLFMWFYIFWPFDGIKIVLNLLCKTKTKKRKETTRKKKKL